MFRRFYWRTIGLAAVIQIGAVPLSSVGAAEPATRPVDPRWRNLPHTDTVFVPRHFGSLAEWTAWREHLRKQILWAAGLWPMPEKTPLNPQIFGRLEREGYTVEKVYFESCPGFLVTGNLYRPSPSSGRHPGVACPHGHWAKGRLNDDERGSVPARCITLARLGCVVFSYDMVGYNDSGKQIADHRFTDERASLYGISPLGLQLWNSIRVVDFLQSLPDVDAERIACTGASGGGTQTFLLCAVDDRVKVAAPVNMISNHMQGGCVCENAPCLRFDTNNIEFGAMMAPRPLLLVSATGDWTRNTPNIEYPAIREIYKLYGAEGKVACVQFQAEHNYNKASREAVYRFFGRWLLHRDDMADFTEPPYPREKDEDLLVFHDRPLPAGALPNTEAIIGERIAAARKQLESLKHPADPNTARRARDVLRDAFRLATGATPPGPGDIAYESRGFGGGNAGYGGFGGGGGERKINAGLIVDRRRGTRIPTVISMPANNNETDRPIFTLLIHGNGKGAWGPELAALVYGTKDKGPIGGRSIVLPGDVGRSRFDFIPRLVSAGHTVVAIDVFGAGEAVADEDTKPLRGDTKFFTTFNRTDTAERVCDVVTAIGFCLQGGVQAGKGGASVGTVNVVGLEQGGPWCALATATLGVTEGQAPPVRVVIDADRLNTSSEEAYLRHLYVPGILRAGGLPAAVALIPPAQAMLHNTGDHFDTSWLKDVGMPVKVMKGRASDEEIIAWLTEQR